jgi:hypothetical protein
MVSSGRIVRRHYIHVPPARSVQAVVAVLISQQIALLSCLVILDAMAAFVTLNKITCRVVSSRANLRRILFQYWR